MRAILYAMVEWHYRRMGAILLDPNMQTQSDKKE